MRIVKDAEERKNEILDAASDLFRDKGFAGTTTGDILERVGIARGTLYYHFKSKEDVMDALIARFTTSVIEAAREAAADAGKPLVERLLSSLVAMKAPGGDALAEHIHRPENALMHRRIQQALLAGLTPILANLVDEGVARGLFHTPYPYEAVETVMIYASAVFDDDIVDLDEAALGRRARALMYNAERLFGVETGAFSALLPVFGPSDAR